MLDGDHRHGLRFGEMVARHGHYARDGSRSRHAREGFCVGSLRTAPPRRPFGDDPQTASEALSLQGAPKRCPIALTCLPLGLEPRKPGFQRALTCPEDLASLPEGCGAPFGEHGQCAGQSP